MMMMNDDDDDDDDDDMIMIMNMIFPRCVSEFLFQYKIDDWLQFDSCWLGGKHSGYTDVLNSKISKYH